uniref:Photosystem I assembly protein Ycf4 n=1 Tax=Lobochlamys segnis TaxID=52035 RepID=A0A0S2ICW3_9CHLO|nr:hypothetical chloroplast RF4 [Lobochlamys segnis]
MVNNIGITKETNLIRRYIIIGERRISNYWWASVVLLGALGFLLTGICSFFEIQINLVSFLNQFNASKGVIVDLPLLNSEMNTENSQQFTNNIIAFFPQGLLMSFYGSLGFLLSIYWWLLVFWNVGGGFNEFNKQDGLIRIFRWGYPGKNRRIDLSYSLKDVEAIRVELKQGLDPQRTIYMRLKGKREIPLTGIGQPLTLKEIEKQASELANFLQVPLEGL